MFDDYLNDKCDIYHLAASAVTAGYGINATSVMDWQSQPAATDVSCHFHIKNDALQVAQAEPQSELQGNVKLTLPAGTDIRKNDLVISKTCASIESGLRFRADTPRTIFGNHHIIVTLRREEGLKGAI